MVQPFFCIHARQTVRNGAKYDVRMRVGGKVRVQTFASRKVAQKEVIGRIGLKKWREGLASKSQSEQALPGKRRKRCTAQAFQYVSYHKHCNKWQVQKKKHRSGKRVYFATALDAAEHVAKKLKVTVQSLRLYKKSKHHPHPRLRRQQQFKWLFKVYLNALPGDVADLTKRARKSMPQLLQQEPGLVVTMLISKYTGDRNALETAWKDFRQRSQRLEKGMHCNAQEIHFIMQHAARMRSGKVWPKAWRVSVGRNQEHWMLMHHHMAKLGVLTGNKPRGWTGKGWVFQASGKQFYPTKFNAAVQRKIETNIDFGKLLLSATVPRTVLEYGAVVESLQASNVKVVGASGKKTYCKLWLIRAWMIFAMRARKIGRLQLDGCTVRQMQEIFPDQKNQVLLLARLAGEGIHQALARSVESMFQNLAYTGPCEYFTMYSCFFSNKVVTDILCKRKPEWLKSNCNRLQKRRRTQQKKDTINPHVAILFVPENDDENG